MRALRREVLSPVICTGGLDILDSTRWPCSRLISAGRRAFSLCSSDRPRLEEADNKLQILDAVDSMLATAR